MKTANKNEIRQKYVQKLFEFLSQSEVDMDMITSGSFNFPVVSEDGEEGWVEIVVKVPNDEGDEGFDKQAEYKLKVANAAAKKEKAEREKALKIQKQQERAAQKAIQKTKINEQLAALAENQDSKS